MSAPEPRLTPELHAAALRLALQQLGDRLVQAERERDAAVARADVLQSLLNDTYRENAYLRRECAEACGGVLTSRAPAAG